MSAKVPLHYREITKPAKDKLYLTVNHDTLNNKKKVKFFGMEQFTESLQKINVLKFLIHYALWLT